MVSIAVSGKGYNTDELGLDYIKGFDEQTKHKNNHTQVLFLDGHSSHCTVDLLDYAMAKNIEVISYPPHTTHALQGLNVTCFGPLKIYLHQETNA